MKTAFRVGKAIKTTGSMRGKKRTTSGNDLELFRANTEGAGVENTSFCRQINLERSKERDRIVSH